MTGSSDDLQFGAFEQQRPKEDATGAFLRIAHAREHCEAAGERLRERGWTGEEIVVAICRRATAESIPLRLIEDEPCIKITDLQRLASAIAAEHRMSLHLARRCPCGKGVLVPETPPDVFDSVAKPVPLAIVRRALFVRPGTEWTPTALAAVQVDADARLRCPRCGEAGAATHAVVMEDGVPIEAMPTTKPFMEMLEVGE
jgi:hypothetical protein